MFTKIILHFIICLKPLRWMCSNITYNFWQKSHSTGHVFRVKIPFRKFTFVVTGSEGLNSTRFPRDRKLAGNCCATRRRILEILFPRIILFSSQSVFFRVPSGCWFLTLNGNNRLMLSGHCPQLLRRPLAVAPVTCRNNNSFLLKNQLFFLKLANYLHI